MIKKKDKETKGELIFGIHPVIELLKAKRRKLISLYTTKPTPQAFDEIQKVWPKYPVPIQYVAREVLDRMAGTSDHQSVVAWVQSFPYRKQFFDAKKHKFLVMLDGVQDPRNVGAILRSAYCTGVEGAIMIKRGGAQLTGVAIKSAAGLSEHLEIYAAQSAQSAVLELKNAGYNIYLTTFDGENATTCKYSSPMCIVIGGEGLGISKSILSSGTRVTLPQKTSDISYNASVAAGIMLFLVSSQQNKI
ncbi:MAG TPA: RNA methyltransferase [Candidatus Babeliales bacterium]|jgi:23S rRNA (guanosine2251-2'-O)-methyltransferase|nr:RNA methyltransferase [Candidatus Babeliales bacterium]